MKMSIQKTDGNNIKIIDGVSYDEWFGRESESAREFGSPASVETAARAFVICSLRKTAYPSGLTEKDAAKCA